MQHAYIATCLKKQKLFMVHCSINNLQTHSPTFSITAIAPVLLTELDRANLHLKIYPLMFPKDLRRQYAGGYAKLSEVGFNIALAL